MLGNIVNEQSGIVTGIKAKFLDIVNHGIVNLESCNIVGEVKSFGEINANNTFFKKNVTVCDGNAIFNNCQLENLFIKDDLENTLPTVMLNGTTTVNGSIIFTTGRGVVYKSPSCTIVGQVINGSILNLK